MSVVIMPIDSSMIRERIMKAKLKEYGLLTISVWVMVAGIYFFKFPNHFSFGGVTGIVVVFAKYIPISPSDFVFIINMIMLVLGFITLGKKFGIKTAYASILMSVSLAVLEVVIPLTAPLTTEPILELFFAILLPSIGSGILFNMGASSGGTDIVALMLKKYTNVDIGRSLFLSDFLITASTFFVFDITTGLYSVVGLLVKSLLVDSIIESINLCKYFNVVCNNPKPICNFIVHELNRSATVCSAKGAFSNQDKYIIFTAMSRVQAVKLRQYIRQHAPDAFMLICNSSEIIGKGFRGF